MCETHILGLKQIITIITSPHLLTTARGCHDKEEQDLHERALSRTCLGPNRT